MEPSNPLSHDEKKPWGMDLNTFLLLMHLSQLSSFVLPGAGLVLPIVMWATNKDDFEEVDVHGKHILNWLLSCIIYMIVSVVLCLVFIGFFLIFALVLIDLIFVIIAAVKASERKAWPYPLSIRFFK